MKPFGTERSIRYITHRAGRAAVLLGLVWAGHAQALPMQTQIEARSYQAAKQRMAVNDCLPCASCHMAPSPAKVTGSGDPPRIAASPWAMRLDQPVDSQPFRTGVPVRPVLALRVLYCRWLN